MYGQQHIRKVEFDRDDNINISLFEWTLIQYISITILIVLLVTLAVYVFVPYTHQTITTSSLVPIPAGPTFEEFTSTTKMLASEIVMSIIHTTAYNPYLHLMEFASTLPIVSIPRKAVEFLWQDIKSLKYEPKDFVNEEKTNTIWQSCPLGKFEDKTDNSRQIIYKSGEHSSIGGVKIFALISSARRESDTFGSVYTLVEPGIMVSTRESRIFDIQLPIKVANYEYKNTAANCLESILILPSIVSKLQHEKPHFFVATYSSITSEDEFDNSLDRLHKLLSQTYNLSNEPVISTKNVLFSMVMMIKLNNKDNSPYNTAAKVLDKFKQSPLSAYLNVTLLSNRDGFYKDKTLNIDFSEPQNIGVIPTTYVYVKMFLTDYDLFERFGHTLNEHYEELNTLTNVVWKGVPTTTTTVVRRKKRSASEGDRDKQDGDSLYENIDSFTLDDYRHDGDATSIATELSTADQFIEDVISVNDDDNDLSVVNNLDIGDISIGKNLTNFTDEMYSLTNSN